MMPREKPKPFGNYLTRCFVLIMEFGREHDFEGQAEGAQQRNSRSTALFKGTKPGGGAGMVWLGGESAA